MSYGTSQTFTITPDANHAISGVIVDGVDIGPVSSYTFESVIESHSISAVFIAGSRRIPAADQLFVALDSSDIVGTSSITSWPWRWPAGNTLTKIGSPTVQNINGARWESNLYIDGDGFRVGQYAAPIAVNGSTAVCAIKPVRNSTSSSWTSVVDVMYGELVLGISNVTGLPTVRLKNSLITGPTAIPNGQATILSLVVQPGGAFTVHANGELIMTGSGPAMTEWKPGNTTGNPGSFDNTINIGRNGPDGWTTFNDNIGDVFLYKTALSDAQRIAQEADLMDKFAIGGSVGGNYTITASAGTGGTITPAGPVPVAAGSNQEYLITPSAGYDISEVWIDGIPVGVAGSYTFANVLADHTIAAGFRQEPADIILSRSSGTGAITTYGDALGFVVTVAGFPFATGTVTLRDGGVDGTVLGSGTLDNGSCTVNPAPTALNSGLHDNLAAVYAGDSYYPAMSSNAPDPQTVNPRPVVVTAVTAIKTYDGTTTAIGTPSLVPQLVEGDAATILNQQYLTIDADAGNKVIVPNVAINDGNGGGNYAVTLQNFTGGTILPAPASIMLGDLEHTHDGTPKAASATTDPSGLAVEFTYDAVPTPPGTSGSYTVVATITDSNHTGTALGILVIAEDAMSAWRNRHFTPEEIAAGLAADDQDPDGDGATNLAEFAFNGAPCNGSSRGLFFRRLADGPDGDSDPELEFTCAVRRGAEFSSSVGNSQLSLLIDGVVYRVEGSLALTDPWDGVISEQGTSDTAPSGSGLPDLTGTGWRYHTFSAFNGLQGRGFVRVRFAKP